MALSKLHVLASAVLTAYFLMFSQLAHSAETSTANVISGHGSTGPGGYDLTVSGANAKGALGHVKLLGGITGPVVEVVPPAEGQDCWCLNVKRTDTSPVDGDQRANVYIRDTGDGVSSFDQISFITSIGSNCNSFATTRLFFLPITRGDFTASAAQDSDGDGIVDDRDACPNTPAGDVVNSRGCSIDQLAPCSGPAGGGTWYSHAQYVAAVTKVAQAFYVARLITLGERNEIIRNAAMSDCGKNPSERRLFNRRLEFRTHRGQAVR
jgi:hypothetical protein